MKLHLGKIVVLSLSAMVFVLPITANAGGRSSGGKGGAEAYRKAQMEAKREREARQAERTKKREALDKYIDPLDKNSDGSISLSEFLNDGTEEEFKAADKNRDRSLSKSEIADMIGLEDKVTVSKKKK